MAILAFQKPEKVIMLESTSSFGRFEFRPLEPGFGMTIGNALRRILLSSLEGYAITTVKVAGVDHEFAAIPGVMEGMLEIILKLKQVRFIKTVENVDGEKVIEIKITQENDMAKITVFNTGTPIPEEDLPHIWEKFYKVDKARTREYGGNGIGLSIVKAIMDSFGKGYGAINHTNGVEFWFELDMK